MTKQLAIIDDEIEMGDIYSLLFEDEIKQQLLSVNFFSDVRKFLEWLENHDPDLILTDINMPIMSGTELGRRIRQLGKQTPTYFISGFDRSLYEKELAEIGSCRYITKPLDLDHVHDTILSDLHIPLS
jgi:DNA-binding NtrC family response regulator